MESMESSKLNLVVVKSDRIKTAIVRYMLFANKFLSLEEKKEIEKLSESDFLDLVQKNNWSAKRQER